MRLSPIEVRSLREHDDFDRHFSFSGGVWAAPE
jgi:hypothetical protein